MRFSFTLAEGILQHLTEEQMADIREGRKTCHAVLWEIYRQIQDEKAEAEYRKEFPL